MQDPFLDVRDAVDFLDSKRTSMQLVSVEGKLGHMPQEDFAEAVGPLLANFFAGEDITVRKPLCVAVWCCCVHMAVALRRPWGPEVKLACKLQGVSGIIDNTIEPVNAPQL